MLATLVTAVVAVALIGALTMVVRAAIGLRRELRPELAPTTSDLDAEFTALTARADVRAEVRVAVNTRIAASARRIRGIDVVTITTELLKTYTPAARIGVLGHELAHIVTGDTRRAPARAAALMAVLGGPILLSLVCFAIGQATIAAAVWIISLGGLLWWTAGSRRAEFEADRVGATLTGPAAAIASLENLQRERPRNRRTTWLDTHPSTGARIQRLTSDLGAA